MQLLFQIQLLLADLVAEPLPMIRQLEVLFRTLGSGTMLGINIKLKRKKYRPGVVLSPGHCAQLSDDLSLNPTAPCQTFVEAARAKWGLVTGVASIRGNNTIEIQAYWHTEAGRSGCVGHASAWRKHALLRAGAPPRQGHKKRKIFGAESTASSSWSWAFFRVQTCCDFSRLQFESPNESSLASVLV